MKSYTPDSPPKQGTAKKLWNALTDFGYKVVELHYNPNNFGAGKYSSTGAWGNWAFSEQKNGREGMLCGIDKGTGKVWVSGLHAGSARLYLADKETVGIVDKYRQKITPDIQKMLSRFKRLSDVVPPEHNPDPHMNKYQDLALDIAELLDVSEEDIDTLGESTTELIEHLAYVQY